MTETKSKNNFTSYLELGVLNESEDAMHANIVPKLLAGELEVANARNVLLYAPCDDIAEDPGIPGILVVTNFKLSFLSFNNGNGEAPSLSQENVYLGKNDVTLSNIDHIYQINDRRKRKLVSNQKISSKIEGLCVVCKNFRVFKFSFKKSELGRGKHIAEALVKFAFPNRHNLLFSYQFREIYYNTSRNISMFNKKSDWASELVRCGALNWRVLSLEREDNIPLGSLPMHFVIPKSVTEIDYLKLSECFRNSRAAIWVFSLENASLVRMAELIPSITDTKQENTMLELVRKCDPLMRQPYIMELSNCLPSIQDVYSSYTKLRELLAPDSAREFMLQDAKFYSFLDKTYWLLNVSLCLKYSSEAAQKMRNGQTVVLQENDGRDMCCVISSLTQIQLDPVCRTIVGFQSLIQKEWVALGHPFSDRLGHVINSDTTEQSPLFLLFLDCTWQMLQQFPDAFEFSETYLTTLWDSAFLPIFDTFQFNSEHDRQYAARKEQCILRPVWDWGEQFSDRDILLFSNPLYKKPPPQDASNRKTMIVLPPNAIQLPGMSQMPSSGRMSISNISPQQRIVLHQQTLAAAPTNFLEPYYTIRNLEIWMQCYFRWNPLLEIKNGGNPQIELFNRIILSNIGKLQKSLLTGEFEEEEEEEEVFEENVGRRTTSAAKDDIEAAAEGGAAAAAEAKYDDEEGAVGPAPLPPPPPAHSPSVLTTMNNQTMPSLSSFFPFSGNSSNANELTDILVLSNDLLTEGSIFDGLSMYQEPD